VTTNSQSTQAAAVQLAGRILLGVLFLLAGVGKLGNPAGTQAYIASAGLPLPLISYIGTLVIEIGGGLLLLVGYRARLVSVILAAFTLVAAAFFHHAFGDQNQFVHFMKNLAIAGGLLQIAAIGAGGFSLDNRRARATAPSFA